VMGVWETTCMVLYSAREQKGMEVAGQLVEDWSARADGGRRSAEKIFLEFRDRTKFSIRVADFTFTTSKVSHEYDARRSCHLTKTILPDASPEPPSPSPDPPLIPEASPLSPLAPAPLRYNREDNVRRVCKSFSKYQELHGLKWERVGEQQPVELDPTCSPTSSAAPSAEPQSRLGLSSSRLTMKAAFPFSNLD
jgi:hypothetical protein